MKRERTCPSCNYTGNDFIVVDIITHYLGYELRPLMCPKCGHMGSVGAWGVCHEVKKTPTSSNSTSKITN